MGCILSESEGEIGVIETKRERETCVVERGCTSMCVNTYIHKMQLYKYKYENICIYVYVCIYTYIHVNTHIHHKCLGYGLGSKPPHRPWSPTSRASNHEFKP